MSISKKKEVFAKKIKAMKRNLAKKLAKVSAVAFAVMLVGGCATSDPASRLTSARYGDIVVLLEGATNNVINITIGDGALASADSSGSTENVSTAPKNDVTPDIDASMIPTSP